MVSPDWKDLFDKYGTKMLDKVLENPSKKSLLELPKQDREQTVLEDYIIRAPKDKLHNSVWNLLMEAKQAGSLKNKNIARHGLMQNYEKWLPFVESYLLKKTNAERLNIGTEFEFFRLKRSFFGKERGVWSTREEGFLKKLAETNQKGKITNINMVTKTLQRSNRSVQDKLDRLTGKKPR